MPATTPPTPPRASASTSAPSEEAARALGAAADQGKTQGKETMTAAEEPEFEVAAWSNGATGYGLKLSAVDRDAHLKREWRSVDLFLPNRDRPIKVNIDKDSLWDNACRELISKEIGAWLIDNGVAPWPKGSPPKFKLVYRAPREFDLVAAA